MYVEAKVSRKVLNLYKLHRAQWSMGTRTKGRIVKNISCVTITVIKTSSLPAPTNTEAPLRNVRAMLTAALHPPTGVAHWPQAAVVGVWW